MKADLRRSAEWLLARSSGPLRLRRGWLGQTLLLAYHNIVPNGEEVVGERSLHLSQRSFADQLDALTRTHEIVSIESLVDGRPRSRKPRAVITFDDAYRGAVRAGVSELAKRGLPGTIFVAPGFVPNGSFWWDRLAGPQGMVAEDVRTTAMKQMRGIDSEIRKRAVDTHVQENALPVHALAATLDELKETAAIPGITLGSHSWAHPNLAELTTAEVETELRESLDWIRAHFSNVVPWLSYPYGLFTPEVERVAERVGYAGAVTISGGWLKPDHERRFAVPRLNVPSGVTLSGFSLRSCGIVQF